MAINEQFDQILRGELSKDGKAGMVRYAEAVSMIESSGGQVLHNGINSCSGAFQFSDGTYNQMVAEIKVNHPDVAGEMQRQGKNSSYAQVHAFKQYAEDNGKTLESHGIEASGVNIYIAHFLGPGDAVKVLNCKDDSTPMTSIVQSASVHDNKMLASMTVGQFKAYETQNLKNLGDTANFVYENNYLNPGDSKDQVLANLAKNGHQADVDELKTLLSDERTSHQGLLKLKELDKKLLGDAGVDVNNAEAQHLSAKFGAFDAIAIEKAAPEKKLSELGVSPEATAAYQKENAAELKGAAEKDQDLKGLLDKKPEDLTAGDIKKLASARAKAYNTHVQGMRTRMHSADGDSPEDSMLDGFLKNMMVDDNGQIGIGGLLILALLSMVFGDKSGGLEKIFGGLQTNGTSQLGDSSPPDIANPEAQKWAQKSGVAPLPGVSSDSHSSQIIVPPLVTPNRPIGESMLGHA